MGGQLFGGRRFNDGELSNQQIAESSPRPAVGDPTSCLPPYPAHSPASFPCLLSAHVRKQAGQLPGHNPAGGCWDLSPVMGLEAKKGLAEDEMVGCHHLHNGHEFEQTLGNSEG